MGQTHRYIDLKKYLRNISSPLERRGPVIRIMDMLVSCHRLVHAGIPRFCSVHNYAKEKKKGVRSAATSGCQGRIQLVW